MTFGVATLKGVLRQPVRKNKQYNKEDFFLDWKRNRPEKKSCKYFDGEAKLYYSFMSRVNELMREHLIKFGKLELPRKFGTITLFEKDNTFRDFNVVNLAINWKETNKLWEEHPELRKKEFVRYDHAYNAHVSSRHRYKLLSFITFKLFPKAFEGAVRNASQGNFKAPTYGEYYKKEDKYNTILW